MESLSVRLSVSLPAVALELIDEKCGGKGGKGGLDGRSAWIRRLVMKELELEEESQLMLACAEKKRNLPNPYRGDWLRIDYNGAKNAQSKFFTVEYCRAKQKKFHHKFFYPDHPDFPTGMNLKKKVESWSLKYDLVYLAEAYKGNASFEIPIRWGDIRSLKPFEFEPLA